MIPLAIVLAVLLGVSLVATAALNDFSRSRLERYCETRRAERLGAILSGDEDAHAALRFCRWLLFAALFTVLVAMDSLAKGAPDATFGAALWRYGLVGFKLGVAAALGDLVIARPIGQAFAEPALYWLWPAIEPLRWATRPLIHLGELSRRGLDLLAGHADENRASPIQDEILTVVNEGEREGAIHEDAAEMIEGLMELHEAHVSDIMTPRTDMVMLKRTATFTEASAVIIESGHSRIPVHGDTRDEIVGLLYAKDLLPFLPSTPDALSRDLSSLALREPMYVPETKPVNVLLKEFQRGRAHIAIVLDEYGGVAGLVTIEDILEEIVGEIADEHDPAETAPIQATADGVFDVDGRVRIDELNEEASFDLPEHADFDTIGGFVFNHLGRIPKVGESFSLGDAQFTVLAASDRAIQRVRVERATKANSADVQPVAE